METMRERALPGKGSPRRVFPHDERGADVRARRGLERPGLGHLSTDPNHVVVYRPARQYMPTRRGARSPSGDRALLPSDPGNKVKHPYELLFGDEDCLFVSVGSCWPG
jgi:hypothetical protein